MFYKVLLSILNSPNASTLVFYAFFITILTINHFHFHLYSNELRPHTPAENRVALLLAKADDIFAEALIFNE